MPTLRHLLNEIRDELDSRQIVVAFKVAHGGVEILAEDYAALLIAKRELSRHGIEVSKTAVDTKEAIAQNPRTVNQRPRP